MWGILIGQLIGALVASMGSLVGRALIGMGVAFVAFQGFDTLLQWSIEGVKSSMSGLPAEAAGLLGYLWVDKAISMIASSYTVALALRMAGGSDIVQRVTKR